MRIFAKAVAILAAWLLTGAARGHAAMITVDNQDPNASDSNAGTSEAPLKTIQAAADRAQPGDLIMVRSSIYDAVYVKRSGRYDTSLPYNGYISFRAAQPGKVLIRTKSVYDGAFNIRGGGRWGDMHKIALQNGKPGTFSGEYPPDAVGFVEVNGFDLQCNGEHSTALTVSWAHHIRVLNNKLHNGGLAGLSAVYCDYVLAEGNEVFDNARTSSYRGSGLDFWRPRPYAGGVAGWRGERLQVRRNKCYNNGHEVGRDFNGDKAGLNHTDGNGIILDIGALNVSALVENNVCFNNGGRGICVTGWKNAVVRNNTLWHNVTDPAMSGEAELGIYEVTWGEAPEENTPSKNISVSGNIIVAQSNRAVLGQYSSGKNGANLFTLRENLLWNETGHAAGEVSLLKQNTNGLTVDPQLVAPDIDAQRADFRLQENSPARGKLATAPADDFSGARRLHAPFDLGAYQFNAQLPRIKRLSY